MSNPPAHTDGLPVEKAGFVIYGRLNANGPRALVVPYSEGRYNDTGDKFYTLPKGSIEDGESIFDAALRETVEETGIDIEKLLGADNLARLRAGQDVGPFESPDPDYAGVKILRASATPHTRNYLSNGGTEFATTLFGIEVEGIECLTRSLKNHDNVNTSKRFGTVKYQLRDIIKHNPRYPRREDFLQWLRSGEMPMHRDWSRGRERPGKLFEKEHGQASLFERLEHRFTEGKKITTGKQWEEFLEGLSKDSSRKQDYETLRSYFETIKLQLLKLKVINDFGTIKLDDKRLIYYQEGADILQAKDFIASCLKKSKGNKTYARSIAGRCKMLEDAPWSEQIAHSQLAMLMPFVELPELMELGMKDAPRKTLKAAKDGEVDSGKLLRKRTLGLVDAHPDAHSSNLPTPPVAAVQPPVAQKGYVWEPVALTRAEKIARARAVKAEAEKGL